MIFGGITYAAGTACSFSFLYILRSCIRLLCGFVLLFCAYLCAWRLFTKKKLATLEEQMHKLMDDSQEVQNLLKEKNQMLLDNQTYHIRVATLSERNRIAREIHDCVGHLLILLPVTTLSMM